MIPQRFSVILKQLREEIEKTTDPDDLYDLDEQIDDLAGLAADTVFKLEKRIDEDDQDDMG